MSIKMIELPNPKICTEQSRTHKMERELIRRLLKEHAVENSLER